MILEALLHFVFQNNEVFVGVESWKALECEDCKGTYFFFARVQWTQQGLINKSGFQSDCDDDSVNEKEVQRIANQMYANASCPATCPHCLSISTSGIEQLKKIDNEKYRTAQIICLAVSAFVSSLGIAGLLDSLKNLRESHYQDIGIGLLTAGTLLFFTAMVCYRLRSWIQHLPNDHSWFRKRVLNATRKVKTIAEMIPYFVKKQSSLHRVITENSDPKTAGERVYLNNLLVDADSNQQTLSVIDSVVPFITWINYLQNASPQTLSFYKKLCEANLKPQSSE